MNVGVDSPEALLVEASRWESVAKIAARMMEAMGDYRLDAGHPHGFVAAAPATDCERLFDFISENHPPHARRLLRALKFAAPGAASPRETVVYLLLCLPAAMGGYGLPAPLLNERLRFEDGFELTPDFYWPRARVAAEYDSGLFHEEADEARDFWRRSGLAARGVSVVRILPSSVKREAEFHQVALELARLLGERVRVRGAGFFEARARLRFELGVYS